MYDKIMSISAMITALIAVVIGVVELQNNRDFQRLSVEPYLELANSNKDGYEILLVNSGLGPARIKTVDVEVDGSKVSHWGEVVKKLTGEKMPIVYSSLWNGRQIKPEEQIALMHIEKSEAAKQYFKNSSMVNIKICYCSIYGDCWLKKNFKNPVAIKNCPVNGRERFPYAEGGDTKSD